MEPAERILVEGRIKIPYRWPAGEAGSRFLNLLREEKRFEGLRCPKCGKVNVPPRPRCLVCHVTSNDWVAVGPEGTVTTWTRRSHEIFALVQLDGADTALLHRLVETDEPQTGMRVAPVLKSGLIGFRPLAKP